MSKMRLKDPKVMLFIVVGIINTLVDLIIYITLLKATDSIIVANIFATTAALITSYVLNSRFTFKKKTWKLRNFIAFFAVTIFGLWVLQTWVIHLLTPLMTHIPDSIWNIAGGAEETAKALLPKLMATAVSLVWNFVWYNRVIFKNESKRTQAVIALEEL